MTHGKPCTERQICSDLLALGVASGMVLTVHSSLSAIGWVIGGAQSLVRALINVAGDQGTLIMPAASPQCADPYTWSNSTLPKGWLPTVYEHLPVFDRNTTPTSLGAVPEAFRTWPGTVRSDHPLESVCARGLQADAITAAHPHAYSEGHAGPFGRLFDCRSWVLLIGVGFNRCTALHYAESLEPNHRTTTVGFPVLIDGQRHWVEAPNVADDNDRLFPDLGRQFLATARPSTGRVGSAEAVLFPMRDLVQFARTYFQQAL